MLYLIIRFIALVLSKVLFRLERFGTQNIPLKGGFILAANHSSYLDPPLLAAACPRVLSFLAIKSLFKHALFGGFISRLNAFPIKSHSGDIKAMRWAIKILQQGRGLLIFPEGGRYNDGRLHEPLEGIGLIAAKTKVPVVPAFIQDTDKALPMHGKFIRPKKIKVYFGQAIRIQNLKSQLSNDDFYQRIAQKTMEEIRGLKEQNTNSQ